MNAAVLPDLHLLHAIHASMPATASLPDEHARAKSSMRPSDERAGAPLRRSLLLAPPTSPCPSFLLGLLESPAPRSRTRRAAHAGDDLAAKNPEPTRGAQSLGKCGARLRCAGYAGAHPRLWALREGPPATTRPKGPQDTAPRTGSPERSEQWAHRCSRCVRERNVLSHS